MTQTKEKVVLVVGAGSGMGRLHARRAASSGLRVAIADRNLEGLRQTQEGHPEMLIIPCDITAQDEVASMVNEVSEKLGPIDRLIHTAGIMPTALIQDMSPDEVSRVMRVNFDGAVNTVTAVLPSMLARRQGKLVVYGSVAGYALTPHLAAYCASKAAINAYMEILSEELKGSGVEVHLICPPMVNTPLIDQARNTSNPKSIQQAARENLLADPEAVVDAVEKGIERGRAIVLPLAMAKALFHGRRLAPRLMWKVIRRSEEM